MSTTLFAHTSRRLSAAMWLFGCLLVAGLLLPGCSGSAPTAPSPQTAQPPTTVRVVVPEPSNLQFMSFWIALGAGFFADEGLDIQLTIPPQPGGSPQAPQFLLQGNVDVAVLPPPIYLNLIGQQQPILIFANLLQNDQINLVVRKDILEARNISLTAPVSERLQAIKGLRVGVAPGPPTRLRALLDSVGLNADRDIQMVVMPPREENPAFGARRVDALYAHTPYLETALMEQQAVIVVNQSRGEVPELAGREIHSLVTTRSFASAYPERVAAMTRAILRAQRLVHADQKAAVDAIMRANIPDLKQPLVETIVSVYEPAIPLTPEVSVEGIVIANQLFPESQTPPDLSKINLAEYIAPQFALQAADRGR